MRDRRVFYFAFDHGNPSGGIKQAYQQVDVLNAHGIEAYILHQTTGARASWFQNETAIIDPKKFSELFDDARDVVVLPEDLINSALYKAQNKVIHNQNVFYGFGSLGQKAVRRYPHLDDGIIAAFVGSEHNAAFLQYAYPDLKIYRLYHGIDLQRFRYVPPNEKAKKICCHIQKNPLHATILYQIAQSRSAQGLNRFGEFEWVVIDGKQTEDQVTEMLQEASVFIFLSVDEGFGLMPLEAAASGAIPLVYDSGPVTEWVPEPCRFTYGDLVGMVKAIESIIDGLPDDGGEWAQVSQLAKDKASFYSCARRDQRLLDVWKQVLASLD